MPEASSPSSPAPDLGEELDALCEDLSRSTEVPGEHYATPGWFKEKIERYLRSAQQPAPVPTAAQQAVIEGPSLLRFCPTKGLDPASIPALAFEIAGEDDPAKIGEALARHTIEIPAQQPAPEPRGEELREWSSERPTEPGWYWLDGIFPMQPVRVFSGDELRVTLGDGSRLLSWSYFDGALWFPIPASPEIKS